MSIYDRTTKAVDNLRSRPEDAIQRIEQCVFCDLFREEQREETSTGKDGPTPENLLTVCHDCHIELEKVTRRLFEWFADDDKLDKYERVLEVSNA